MPAQIATTIGREYMIAHALGFSPVDLLRLTANAFRTSFAPPSRKAALLTALDGPGDGVADASE